LEKLFEMNLNRQVPDHRMFYTCRYGSTQTLKHDGTLFVNTNWRLV